MLEKDHVHLLSKFKQLKLVRSVHTAYYTYNNNYSYIAPSEVNNLVIDAVSNEVIDVLWDPPTRPNGILTHYTIIVFNEMTEFNFSTTVPASDYTEATVTGLRKN